MAGSWMKQECGTELEEPSALGWSQLKQSLWMASSGASSAKSKIHLALNSAEEHRLWDTNQSSRVPVTMCRVLCHCRRLQTQASACRCTHWPPALPAAHAHSSFGRWCVSCSRAGSQIKLQMPRWLGGVGWAKAPCPTARGWELGETSRGRKWILERFWDPTHRVSGLTTLQLDIDRPFFLSSSLPGPGMNAPLPSSEEGSFPFDHFCHFCFSPSALFYYGWGRLL